jgi:hypothetical protein
MNTRTKIKKNKPEIIRIDGLTMEYIKTQGTYPVIRFKTKETSVFELDLVGCVFNGGRLYSWYELYQKVTQFLKTHPMASNNIEEEK